jgi:hypothetical protein
MRATSLSAVLGLVLLAAPVAHAQAIVAQSSGLTNPDHLVDFGANLFSNFTPISTQFPGLVFSHTSYFTTGVSNNLVGGFLTNDFSGGPDTLSVQFASPMSDVSFVYHQVGNTGPTTYRVLLGGVVVDSFSNFSDQFQPNNYFGFTSSVFDRLEIDFVTDFNLDTLAFNDAGPTVVAYCTAGTTSNGCVPAISGAGTASASAGSGFTISVANVEGQRAGLIFYGLDNSNWSPLPWLSGSSTSFLCVKPPTQRTPPQNSGGTAASCNGSLAVDWNAFRAANPGALGAPFQGGETVFAQAWFRDPPAPKTTNLSDGLQFTVQP